MRRRGVGIARPPRLRKKGGDFGLRGPDGFGGLRRGVFSRASAGCHGPPRRRLRRGVREDRGVPPQRARVKREDGQPWIDTLAAATIQAVVPAPGWVAHWVLPAPRAAVPPLA